MLQLLNPVFLFSLLGLAIPVAIHLWSRKAGKRIKIGSIVLLQQAPSKQMRSIRLHELSLLLLRCMLISLLVLLMAQPQWVSTQKKKQAGWVLISPEVFYGLNKQTSLWQTIDTLQQKGYEVRLFESGFSQIQTGQLPGGRSKSTDVSYWSLLKEAEEKLPAGTSIYAITEERLQSFRGKRPATDLQVQWITVPAPDSTSTWLADAFIDHMDSLHIQVGISKPEGNIYQTITYKAPPASITFSKPGFPSFNVSPQNGKYTIAISGTSQAIQADTASLNIGIFFTNETSEDARYVSSALKAIAGFTRRKINLTQIKQVEQIPANTNWIFWLSHQQVPAVWQENVKKGTNLLQYAFSEKFVNISTWLHVPANPSHEIALNRMLEATPEGNTVWESGFGNPVLTQQTQGKGNTFQLYTRFHPVWNGLVWHKSFAETLLQLLYETSWKPQNQSGGKQDIRLISLQQLLPLPIQPTNTLEEPRQIINLQTPLWILIVLVFVLERWISERKRTLTEKQQKKPAQQVVS